MLEVSQTDGLQEPDRAMRDLDNNAETIHILVPLVVEPSACALRMSQLPVDWGLDLRNIHQQAEIRIVGQRVQIVLQATRVERKRVEIKLGAIGINIHTPVLEIVVLLHRYYSLQHTSTSDRHT